ncbi:hypothetical protein EJD97_002575 [Solanum chilense]|uniref:RING-type E3 ubiquitin transferase n=1 Tax=Solanum chilense TaxID=4083 RepID=A0A6N2CD73_SOLCI|nr:hypothetical protein EJD97_002575 [Solanum chilense]
MYHVCFFSSLVKQLAAAMSFHIDRKLIFDNSTGKTCGSYYCNPESPQKDTASIFLIILFTGLGIAVYLFCSFVIHINSRTSSQPEQEVVEEELSDIRTVGLHPSVISTITIHKYKRGEGLIEGTECSVCLSEFREDETFKILPTCNHAFHVPCIDTWLKSHTNCPMCRASIVITMPAATASN